MAATSKLLVLVPVATVVAQIAAEPLRLHPDNPHHLLFRGKPLVVVTSGEHYGAVLNARFDFKRYLGTLAADGMNLTRIFTGLYRESQTDFGISRNTLAPEAEDFITPWLRTAVPGAFDGLNKFDLEKWNPAYFERLKEFVLRASERGIIVEVTLFNTYYQDWQWNNSPLNSRNNVNGTPDIPRTEANTLKHPAMVVLHEAFVRKIVTELRDFDNILYEICNEPYFGGVTLEWQRHISSVVARTEKAFPHQHLIAQNIANFSETIKDPDPAVSIFHFHYARPPDAVTVNYGLNKPIALDETGFDGTLDAPYRIQAWDFLIAGGAYYNNLDYSFTVGTEDGTYAVPGTQPGGGGRTVRRQLKILRDFMAALDFIRMAPDQNVIRSGVPENASARALVQNGKAYAIYVHHGRVMKGYRPGYVVQTSKQRADLVLELPAGEYKANWLNPKTGKIDKSESFSHPGGLKTIASPEYSEDIALDLRRSGDG
jgi:hypothetical protein